MNVLWRILIAFLWLCVLGLVAFRIWLAMQTHVGPTWMRILSG